MLEVIQFIVVGTIFLYSVLLAFCAFHPNLTMTINGEKRLASPGERVFWFIWCAAWAFFWWTLFP